MNKKGNIGKYKVFDVETDTLYDGTNKSILQGDKVLCRRISKLYWSQQLKIEKYNFVVVCEYETFFTKIIKHDLQTGEITCHSPNYLYEDFTLNLNDVNELYNIIRIVHRKSDF